MGQMRITEHIKAPIETVFEIAADIPQAADRMRGISEIEMLTDGEVGVGTRWKETRGGMGTEELTITEFNPPNSYSVGAESCGARFDSRFDFMPCTAGGTNVELTMQWQAVTLLAKLMSPLSSLMMGMAKKSIAKDLADLKTAAESEVH